MRNPNIKFQSTSPKCIIDYINKLFFLLHLPIGCELISCIMVILFTESPSHYGFYSVENQF